MKSLETTGTKENFFERNWIEKTVQVTNNQISIVGRRIKIVKKEFAN